MIKAKSSIAGLENMVFNDLLHMRLNEAFQQIRLKETIKDSPDDMNFTDTNKDDFIPMKQLFKESQ